MATGLPATVILKLDGKKIGQLKPDGNATGFIEPEVNFWQLMRIFQHEEIAPPSAYVKVGKWGQDQFVENTKSAMTRVYRRRNRLVLLKRIAANQGRPMRFAIKLTEDATINCPELCSPNINEINHQHPLVRLLMADGPRPSNLPFYFDARHHNSELELARQLSTALVADRLQGEWDRWGGRNTELLEDGALTNLAWFDDGGASFQKIDFHHTFYSSVFRFDPLVVRRVREMDDFLKGATGEFLGVRRKEDLRDSLGIFQEPSWSNFQDNLHSVCRLVDDRVRTAHSLLQ